MSSATGSSATGSSATRPGTLGSSTTASSTTASSAKISRSSNVMGTIMQNLPWVQLEFETIEDKNVFEAAFDALKRQHGPHLGDEKLRPNYQSSKEQGSLTRKYESAAFDAGAGVFGIESDGLSTEKEIMHPSPRRNSIANKINDSQYYRSSSYYPTLEPDGLSTEKKIRYRSPRRKSMASGFNGHQYYRSSSYYPTLESGGLSIEKEIMHPSPRRNSMASRINDSQYYQSSSHYANWESELSASSTSESSGCEQQRSTSVTQVTRKTRRASIETSAKQDQWRRRICGKIIVFMLWKREQDVCLPNELWSSPASFEFISALEVSPFDKIKGFFETYSGMEWNWWPFDTTVRPLESRKVRIRWQCVGKLNADNTTC